MELRRETADRETASSDYARRFAGEVGTYFLHKQLAIVLEILGCYENPSILDVGGGHGQLAIPLAKRGMKVSVIGSDPSCENRLRRELDSTEYSFTECDLLALPYAEETFDVVLCFRLLPHSVDWQRLLAELSRVARHAVILDYPARRSVNVVSGMFFGWKKKIEKNTRPFELFARSQIADECRKNNCHVKKNYPEFFLPMVLHRKIGSSGFSRTSEQLFERIGATSVFGSPIIAHISKNNQLC